MAGTTSPKSEPAKRPRQAMEGAATRTDRPKANRELRPLTVQELTRGFLAHEDELQSMLHQLSLVPITEKAWKDFLTALRTIVHADDFQAVVSQELALFSARANAKKTHLILELRVKMHSFLACYPLSRGRRAMPLAVLASPARRYQSSIRSLTQDSFAHTRLNPSTVLVGSARQIGLLRMPDSASNAHEDKRVLGRPFLTLASCHHGAVPKHHHEGGAYGLSALGCYPSLAAWPGKGDRSVFGQRRWPRSRR